jgi:hypothetical protein
MPKRININESQWGHVADKLPQVENDCLQMDLVDTKQQSRESIARAFKLGIRYAKAENDLYMRKEIKQKLDDMIQAVDKEG